MNQNYNDEHKFRGTGGMGYQPKYLLAKAPGPTWQDINDRNCNHIYNRDAETFGAIEIAGKVASGITSSVIRSLRLQAQIDEIVAIVLVEVFEVLWPVLEGMWYAMMDAVEILIREAITTAVRSKAQAELDGIRNAIALYQQAFDDWKDNPDNPQLQERVRRQFTATNTIIEFAMPSFAISGFEIPLLVVYAQAANLHLLFLREAVVLGEKWGMSREEVDDYYNGAFGLTERTQLYTNHCSTWYREGLAQSMKLNPGAKIIEQWNLFNDFRREMTLMVLDIVALWPMYDVKLYPVGIKTELTRKIYTPIMGILQDTALTEIVRIDEGDIAAIAAQDLVSTAPPMLFTWLEKQTIYRYNNAIYGYVNFERTTFGKEYIYDYGAWDAPYTSNPKNIPIGSELYDVYKVVTSYSTEDLPPQNVSPIHQLVYYRLKEQQESIISTDTSGGPIDQVSEIPNEENPEYGHRLSYMAGTTSYFYRVGVLNSYWAPHDIALGWTYANVDRKNTIAPDAITQIPAVKGYKIIGHPNSAETEILAVPGPGFTGGDLVGLMAGAELRMKVTNPVSDVAGYHIRIRYATNFPTILGVSYHGLATLSGAFDLPVTYSGDFKTQLAYNAIKYKETIVIPAPIEEEIAEIVLRNEGTSHLLIDKIEFIPMEGSLEEYQAKQDLEKVKKTVNALFTNDAKNALQLNVTDYAVDQAANHVECVSGEFHAQEKMILLDQVKFAKRLSQ
ncbi:insecticidal delta-endotoxin Cry8Ea1 family protein, partial [Bacillus cereus]|uniref:insecticidal delta-endotoxin Cry8Ea1 family protein n=2 Tax=Bacillus cereus TaxID=1396 RepID=UPI000BF9D6EF